MQALIPTAVFIAASHRDHQWQNQLVNHLHGCPASLIATWHDQPELAGEHYSSLLNEAVQHSAAGILLLSDSFFRAEQMLRTVIPVLLHRHQQGMPLFAVLVRPCRWQIVDWLMNPENPVRLLPHNQQALSDTDSPMQQNILLSTVVEEILQARKQYMALQQQQRLHQLLQDYNMTELRELAFQLGINTEQLDNHHIHGGLIVSLLDYLNRHRQVPALLQLGQRQRPQLDWPVMVSRVTSAPPVEAAEPKTENTTEPHNTQPVIYLSCAEDSSSQRIAESLSGLLHSHNLNIMRDRNLGFRDSIGQFMADMGRGKYIILIISDRYLKSERCMKELLYIAEHGDFRDRIFPILLADADLGKATQRLHYIKYWEEQISELDSAMKSVSLANLRNVQTELDRYTRIRAMLDEIVGTLADMQTLKIEEESEDRYLEVLHKALQHKIGEDNC